MRDVLSFYRELTRRAAQLNLEGKMFGKLIANQIEKCRRERAGMLIAVPFLVFNTVMALWLMNALLLEFASGTEGLEGLGALVATEVLLWVWLIGTIILGVMVFATRNRKAHHEPEAQIMFYARLTVGIAGVVFFMSSFSAWAQDSLEERVGNWRISSEIDPISGMESVVARLAGGYRVPDFDAPDFENEDFPNFLYGAGVAYSVVEIFIEEEDKERIEIRCQEGKLSVIILWGLNISASYDLETQRVTFQFDSQPPQDETWSRHIDATFLPNDEEFVRRAMNYKRLMIKTTTQEGETLIRVFDLEGILDAVRAVSSGCNLPEGIWEN